MTIYTEYLSDFAQGERGDHWETAFFVGDVEVFAGPGPASDPRTDLLVWFALPGGTSLDAALRDAASMTAELRAEVDSLTKQLRASDKAASHTALRCMESERELDALHDENKSLRESTYCAYCNKRFDLDNQAADKVTEHILTCPKHPMRGPEAERDALRAEVERLSGLTCASCATRETCEYVDDPYNTSGDCLADK